VGYELSTAGIIFFLALGATFLAALFGRLHSQPGSQDEDLAGRRLNRWLIGLSAGATGNSGFIVTGAVGLGYSGGVHWLMLPIAWLLGDLVYWALFPAKLNRFAREARATTLSEMLTFDLSGRVATLVSVLVAALLVTFLATYTSAQWLAGRKFLSGVFQLTDLTALIFFSLTIVVYSAIGGFRGSVYADTLQALIRVVGTIIALTAVTSYALVDTTSFSQNIAAAGPDFLALFPNGTTISVLGFIGGYAFAAIGFGLGQPQIVTRYFAGSSPEETRAAWWIYVLFLQSTWIAMTSFGIILRGVMPGIADPETGLSLFFQNNIGPLITGLIFADVYATIASTSNSLLIAIAQAFQRDILFGKSARKKSTTSFSMIFLLGVATIGLSLVLPGNVFTIALGAVSKIGAAVAGPVLIKILRWKHSATSLLCAISAGIGAAYVWEFLGYSSTFNEAGIGLGVSLLVNFLVVATTKPRQAQSAHQTR